MDGRKSYPTKSFIGTSKAVKKEVKTLNEYFDKKEVDTVISSQAIKTFITAKKPIEYSIYSSHLVPVIFDNLDRWTKYMDPNLLKRKISEKWSEIKKTNNIKVPKEVDRITVETAIKTLEGFK